MFDHSVCDFCSLPEGSCYGCARRKAEKDFFDRIFSLEEVDPDE